MASCFKKWRQPSSICRDLADLSETTINYLGLASPILGPRWELSQDGDKFCSNNTTLSVKTRSNPPPVWNRLFGARQPQGLLVAGVREPCGLREGPQHPSTPAAEALEPRPQRNHEVPIAEGATNLLADQEDRAGAGPLSARALKARRPGPSHHPLATKGEFIKTEG